MNFVDCLVLAAVAAGVFFAVRFLARTKKKGGCGCCSGCCGSCGGCAGCKLERKDGSKE